MAIETDDRGFSKRIDIAWDAVSVEEWVAAKPRVRTIFLM